MCAFTRTGFGPGFLPFRPGLQVYLAAMAASYCGRRPLDAMMGAI